MVVKRIISNNSMVFYCSTSTDSEKSVLNGCGVSIYRMLNVFTHVLS